MDQTKQMGHVDDSRRAIESIRACAKRANHGLPQTGTIEKSKNPKLQSAAPVTMLSPAR